jgi:hypothetical protein
MRLQNESHERTVVLSTLLLSPYYISRSIHYRWQVTAVCLAMVAWIAWITVYGSIRHSPPGARARACLEKVRRYGTIAHNDMTIRYTHPFLNI